MGGPMRKIQDKTQLNLKLEPKTTERYRRTASWTSAGTTSSLLTGIDIYNPLFIILNNYWMRFL